MNFSDLQILCVGDVMLDRFIYGKIERISPEAPVPVMRRNRLREMLGGAGNVANNIAALGAKTILVGLVGKDEGAKLISDYLQSLPAVMSQLVVSATRPTICKTRLIAANQQVLRMDEESSAPSDDVEQAGLLAAALPWVDSVDAIILSDYSKGVLTPPLIEAITQKARLAGVPVFVDPKSSDFRRYRGATCIKPNLAELALASSSPVDDEAAIIAAARIVLAQAEAKAILVTRSENGMMLVTETDVHVSPVRSREVFDVSGAGDTAMAAFALSVSLGRSFSQATNIANAAAGVVVSKLGTATASINEVLDELAASDLRPDVSSGPGLSFLRDAIVQVQRWKKQGLSVGFTNGCFDILHTGHIVSLAHARKTCDRLIVALNSDASVRGLKGPTRPINTLPLRAHVISALRDVDLVVSFDAPTPLALIKDLLPDVLIKGGDYAAGGVVGGDIVEQAGGRVVFTPFVKGQSTTGLISEIADSLTTTDTP